MNEEKYITDLARRAVEEYIISGREAEIEEEELPEILKREAGVFVTLKKG
jgi:AMMECR1 domain-containing protein